MRSVIKKRLNNIKNDWEIENLYFQKIHASRIFKQLNHFELLKKTINCQGAIVECGVLKGNSLVRFAMFRDYLNMQNKKIYGFDAFGVFPRSYQKTQNKILEKEKYFAEIHDENTGKGFSERVIRNLLDRKKIKNYSLVKGDILISIDNFLKKNKNLKISFLHLDMDVYVPTLHGLEKFYKFLSKKGIVVIDDFNTHPGATLATKEFLKKKKKIIKVLQGLRPTYYFIK